MQPACCRTMENPAGTSAADYTSRHKLASAGIQSRGGRVECVQFCLGVLALRLSSEGSSVRDKDRGFGCIASCVPSPLCCLCSVALASTPFLMSAWRDVVNRRLHRHEKQSRGRQAMADQRQPEWQCARCYMRSFLSKSPCRDVERRKRYRRTHVSTRGV